ncbi:uncharacterized protein LOC132747804 [Ruditapes philippinarum]|uniref:uncharacterized protein LOC132747804 n=1 Tax=Ruditapes philippinarum TaxID=129788 RepID=UPI00295A8303|nr:uncharacterized protein LOC132747804 [Ruditapes philippinarum]
MKKKSNQEGKTIPTSKRFPNKETNPRDEKIAVKMEKLKNNINFEGTVTPACDKSPIRQRPFLREQTSTRESKNSSVKNDVVKQYSPTTLRRIKTESESIVVKQNWRYLSKSTPRKADKQKRGQLKNKDHTDLSSIIKPKGCNAAVNSSETTKKNELLDIMTKENHIDNIIASYLHFVTKENDSPDVSANPFYAAFENRLHMFHGHNSRNNDFPHSEKVNQPMCTQHVRFPQPQFKPLPIKHQCITSFHAKSKTEINQRPNKSKVTSVHEKSDSTGRGKTLTSHLHSAYKENDHVPASVSASRTVFECELCKLRSMLKSELNGYNVCNNDFNSDIYKPTCIQHDCVSQAQITTLPIEHKNFTPFHVKSETKQEPNKSKETSKDEKSASGSRDNTSMQKVHVDKQPTGTQSDVRNESEIIRHENIKKTSECFNESRLPLQSSNRETLILNNHGIKNNLIYSKPLNFNSDWSYLGDTNRINWRYKPSYNSIRRKKYRKTQLSSQHLDSIFQFYSERVTIDVDIKNETHDDINELLDNILNKRENRARFSTEATTEGSYAVGVKVGKAEELDYSVDVLINCQQLELSDEPVNFEFEGDDIDSHDKNENLSIFVDAGKRYFPNERRSLRPNPNEPYVPDGFKAVYVSRPVNSRFPNCCVPDRNRTMILPYYLLSEFHDFVSNAVYGLDAVSLNRGVKGPAVSLTIQQDDGPNISVDITPKLTLSNETISVTDFGWPRRDTNKWLTEDEIDSVICQQIYLVPKGDKYWKISYANCENELLRDIDEAKTWRKACLRIMKRKLMQWKSKSTTGLKEISSYLLKTTLLWLCEILPKDEYWYKEELANRYLNFLQEFAHRLHKRRIGEYFNPTVNLLENKDDDCIDELKDLIEEEISLFNQ